MSIASFNSLYGWTSMLLLGLSVAWAAFTLYLMLSTKYRVRDGVLHVRMGPFNRRVNIESIKSIIQYGAGLGRVYGLGSKIIGIIYDGGSVRVTPKDVSGFLAAIDFRFTGSRYAEVPVSPPRP